MRDKSFNRRDRMEFKQHKQKNKVFFGLTLALIGIALMLRAMDILPHFSLRFSWPIILILVGAFTGIKNNFRGNGWWIVILVGIANLTPQFMIMGKPSTHFVWPAFIILVGLAIAFRPRKQFCPPPKGMGGHRVNRFINNEDTLNVDVTFGGRKEIVTNKDFKGGLVNVTFGGCEINLAQADMTEQTAVIDFRLSFGGVEIVVPSHWDVQNEVSPSFGSVEDERTLQTPTTAETRKTLILRGNCSFGSIEIKSY